MRSVAARAAATALLALAAAGLAADGAGAESAPVLPPVFGVPQSLGPGTHPQASASPSGELTLSWARPAAGGGSEIVATTRPPALPLFPPPRVLAREPDTAQEPHAARGTGGDVAIVWQAAVSRPDGTQPLRLVTVAPDGSPAPVLPLELPERRTPATDRGDVIEASRAAWVTDVAVAADGAVLVVGCEEDYRVSGSGDPRTLAWLRTPGRAFGAPQTFAGCGTPHVAADGHGTILMVRSGPQQDSAHPAAEDVVVTERRPGSAELGPDVRLSEPGEDTTNGASPPGVLMSAAGHAVVFWNGGGLMFATSVTIVAREPGGSWGSRQTGTGGQGFRVSGAMNQRGDAALVWDLGGSGLAGTFRRGGEPFGPGTSSPLLSPSGGSPYPIAVDGAGTAVILRAAFDPRSAPALQALLRLRDGRFAAEIPIAGPGAAANFPQVATDAYGNGSAVWESPVTLGGPTVVLTRPYSILPPVLSDVALGPSLTSLRVATNEPARLSIVARTSRRTASQAVTVAPGRRRIALTDPVRRLLRVRSARLTVRARDGGPGTTTVRPRKPRGSARSAA